MTAEKGKKTDMNTLKYNSNTLKLIAFIAMTTDHLTWVIFPGYQKELWILILHIVGRITAPIMCYFIAEGYYHTRDLKKYMGRLFLFAIISHFAYNFAFGIPFIPFQTSLFNQTGIIWSLAWGLVALTIVKSDNPKLKQWMKTIVVILCTTISFCADWSSIAVLLVLHMGMNRGNFKKQMTCMLIDVAMYAAVYAIFIDPLYGILQMSVVLAIPLLYIYNGERGKWKGMKWFFYLYYPAHLFLCGVIRVVLHGWGGVMIGGIQ